MGSVIDIELLQLLEDRLGKEDGRKVAEAIEKSFEEMKKKAEGLAIQKKLELKDELTKELASKADIVYLDGKIESVRASLEGKIGTEIARLEGKMQSEISRLEGKMQSEISRLEGKMQSEITRLEGKIETEISRLEGKIEKEILRLDRKFTILLTGIFFTIVFLNQNTIEFILKLINFFKFNL